MPKVIEIKRPFAIQLTVILEDSNPFTVSLLANALTGWARENIDKYTDQWQVSTARLDSSLEEVVSQEMVGEGEYQKEDDDG